MPKIYFLECLQVSVDDRKRMVDKVVMSKSFSLSELPDRLSFES